MWKVGWFQKIIILGLSFYAATNTMNAQLLQERRVYYLDCSYSMKSLKIWDKVRENLKMAIDNIKDETTELIVIPFTDRRPTHFPLPIFCEYATIDGKRKLKEAVDDMACDKACNTVHYVPLEDFVNSRVHSSKITYMFLMTDGQNELEIPQFENLLRVWGQNFSDKNVYGFYVMLHKEAKNPVVEHIIEQQEHLWKVETADVDINLIRLEEKATFNIRSDKFVEIPIYGKLDNESILLNLESNDYYEIERNEILDGRLRILMRGKQSQSILPESVELKLTPQYIGSDNYTFLVTDNVLLTCINEKERSLRISVK